MTARSERISFEGSTGALLAARLDVPDGRPRAYALFAHCDREITLEGPLDFDQRQRLLQIAEKCPVHRTLRSETSIVSRLSGPD